MIRASGNPLPLGRTDVRGPGFNSRLSPFCATHLLMIARDAALGWRSKPPGGVTNGINTSPPGGSGFETVSNGFDTGTCFKHVT